MLVQALEELRQTLSKKEQQVWSSRSYSGHLLQGSNSVIFVIILLQVVFREDMFRRELEDLQRRYQVNQDVLG